MVPAVKLKWELGSWAQWHTLTREVEAGRKNRRSEWKLRAILSCLGSLKTDL